MSLGHKLDINERVQVQSVIACAHLPTHIGQQKKKKDNLICERKEQ